MKWKHLWMLVLVAGLAACDPVAISQLQPGVSTEADVIEQFGQPERVWTNADGARTFEYNRQPSGVRNYMITIGPDDRLRVVDQVLTPETFDRIKPGMDSEEVRRMLGKPAKRIPYRLKNEIVWTWKFLDPPSDTKGFNVTFDTDYRVLRSGIGPDPDGPDVVGGG